MNVTISGAAFNMIERHRLPADSPRHYTSMAEKEIELDHETFDALSKMAGELQMTISETIITIATAKLKPLQ